MESIIMNEKRPLMVDPNFLKGELKVINGSASHRYSWFLTDTAGKVFLSGCEREKEVTIDIQNIEDGLYRFRAQGEIFEFNVGIAS